MIDASSILNTPLYSNLKADLKILFDNNIDIKIINDDILNKYMIYKFN